jgi:hypothetical protein
MQRSGIGRFGRTPPVRWTPRGPQLHPAVRSAAARRPIEPIQWSLLCSAKSWLVLSLEPHPRLLAVGKLDAVILEGPSQIV